MLYLCEYCNKNYSNKYTLNKHKNTNKKCLEIQKKTYKNSDKINFICEYCEKHFTSKQSLNSHYDVCICKKIYGKMKKEYDVELDKSKEQQIKIKELEDKIKDLEIEKKIIELQTKNIIYEKDHEFIKEIAKQPKNVNQTNNNNNKYLYLSPLSFTKDEIANTVNNNFTKDHFFNGQKGVAEFTYNNLLLDKNGESKYICTDPSRNLFIYKTEDGLINKDIGSSNLTNIIADDVIVKSKNIYSEELMSKDKDSNKIIGYIDNMMDIANIKNENSKFVKKLAKLSVNKPLQVKEEENYIDSEDEESDSDKEKYTEEYFNEQALKIDKLSKDSVYYKNLKKNLENKKQLYFSKA